MPPIPLVTTTNQSQTAPPILAVWGSKLNSNRDMSKQRKQIIDRINWKDPPTNKPTHQEIHKQIKETVKALRQCERHARELRAQHLEDRANHWSQGDE